MEECGGRDSELPEKFISVCEHKVSERERDGNVITKHLWKKFRVMHLPRANERASKMAC